MDPDWSKLNVTAELLSISPGMLTENEYVCALLHLAPQPAQSRREQLARVVLSTYRFGLRGDEVTGMQRSDWVDEQPDAIVVLVPRQSLAPPENSGSNARCLCSLCRQISKNNLSQAG